jgi:hypothetical protein
MSSQITLFRIKYEQLLSQISDQLNCPYRKHPISGKFEYWCYRIDKDNKVKIKSWFDKNWKRINKELKRIENE